jgi:hypothetical protein
MHVYSQRQRTVFNSDKCFGLYDIFRHECTWFKKQSLRLTCVVMSEISYFDNYRNIGVLGILFCVPFCF